MTVKIFTISHVPPELSQKWLQHLRNFDTAHPGCHFEIGIEGFPDETVQEMLQRMVVEPELKFTKVFERMKTVPGDA